LFLVAHGVTSTLTNVYSTPVAWGVISTLGL